LIARPSKCFRSRLVYPNSAVIFSLKVKSTRLTEKVKGEPLKTPPYCTLKKDSTADSKSLTIATSGDLIIKKASSTTKFPHH